MEDDLRRKYAEMVAFLGGDPVARRSANGLWRIGVHTQQQLALVSLEEIRDIRNVGPRCTERIMACVTGAVAQAAPERPLDFSKIARLLYLMGKQAAVSDSRSYGGLSPEEREHVAAELRRLGDWYMAEHREKEK